MKEKLTEYLTSIIRGYSPEQAVEILGDRGILDYTLLKVQLVRDYVKTQTESGISRVDAMWAASDYFKVTYEYVRKCIYYYNDLYDMTTKKCSKCGEEKAISEFYKDIRGKNGRESKCRKCRNKDSANWASANRSRVNELANKHYHKDIDKSREYYRGRNLARYRMWTITLDDVYIRKQLHERGWRKEDITPEIIEVKRLEILIKRHIRNGKD